MNTKVELGNNTPTPQTNVEREETGHTQEWYVAPGSIEGEYFLIVSGHSVAKIITKNKRTLGLIASAPELLEACKAALDGLYSYRALEGNCSAMAERSQLESAIAKATRTE